VQLGDAHRAPLPRRALRAGREGGAEDLQPEPLSVQRLREADAAVAGDFERW
jgi:hypothetical protein